jgi:hypothetical protein
MADLPAPKGPARPAINIHHYISPDNISLERICAIPRLPAPARLRQAAEVGRQKLGDRAREILLAIPFLFGYNK